MTHKFRCVYCGRGVFDRDYQPHNCVGGFRKKLPKFTMVDRDKDSKDKVFCIGCKHNGVYKIDWDKCSSHTPEECFNPKYIKYLDNYYEQLEVPGNAEYLNYNNVCRGYEKRI